MKERLRALGTAVVLVAMILPTGVAYAEESSSAAGADLALDRTVHRPALARALVSGPDLLAIGPLFSTPGSARQITLGSDLTVRSQRPSPRMGLGVTNLTRGRIAWLDNACAQGGYSSCSDVWIRNGDTQAPLGVSSLRLDFHALQRDREGTFWALAYPERLCWERSEWTSLCGPDTDATTKFLDCQVVGFDSRGRVTYSWFASDHLPPSELRVAQQPQAFATGIRDPFHCNSIEVLGPGARALIVSMRHTDAVYAINTATDGVAWKLGGNQWPGHSMKVTGDGVDASNILDSQHDARLWGDNTLSVFDNGSSSGRTARGLVFDISPGRREAKLVRTFEDPTGRSSACTGSFRRIDADGREFWVAGWGCSASGVTVFTDQGEPVVSAALRQDAVSESFTGVQMGPLRYSLSYRITPLDGAAARR